jgi:hypothetical protein
MPNSAACRSAARSRACRKARRDQFGAACRPRGGRFGDRCGAADADRGVEAVGREEEKQQDHLGR